MRSVTRACCSVQCSDQNVLLTGKACSRTTDTATTHALLFPRDVGNFVVQFTQNYGPMRRPTHERGTEKTESDMQKCEPDIQVIVIDFDR